jgi:hypothetical protein
MAKQVIMEWSEMRSLQRGWLRGFVSGFFFCLCLLAILTIYLGLNNPRSPANSMTQSQSRPVASASSNVEVGLDSSTISGKPLSHYPKPDIMLMAGLFVTGWLGVLGLIALLLARHFRQQRRAALTSKAAVPDAPTTYYNLPYRKYHYPIQTYSYRILGNETDPTEPDYFKAA